MPTFNLRKPPGDDPVTIYISTKLSDGSVVNRRATRDDAWKHKAAFWAFLQAPADDTLILDAVDSETKSWVDDFVLKCSEPSLASEDSFRGTMEEAEDLPPPSEPPTAPPGTDLGVVDAVSPKADLKPFWDVSERVSSPPKEPDILP